MNKAATALLHGAHRPIGCNMTTQRNRHSENSGENHEERNEGAWRESDWQWVIKEGVFEEEHLIENVQVETEPVVGKWRVFPIK